MSWVLGYHSNAAEDSELLGCNGALLDRQVTISCAKEPSKCDRVLVQQHGTSMSGTPSTRLLEHEDEGIMTLKTSLTICPMTQWLIPMHFKLQQYQCVTHISNSFPVLRIQVESLGGYFLMFSRTVAVKQSVKKRCDVLAQHSVTPH
jgi:hypothetical protein